MMISLLYFATGSIAVPLLKALHQDRRFKVLAVVTQADQAAGRKMELRATPVKRIAGELGLPVLQPDDINDPETIHSLKSLSPTMIVVMSYGQILKKALLDLPSQGCINIHVSLLPKYRGASPVQSALLLGETETGISVMRMEEKMDTGPVYERFPLAIGEDDDALSLSEKLGTLAAQKVPESLNKISKGELKSVPQSGHEASYCPKIKKEDGKINWDETAGEITRKIRAYAGWPGTFTFWQDKRLKILKATGGVSSSFYEPGTVFKEGDQIGVAAKKSVLFLREVQLEGKKAMGIQEFLRGYPDFIESKLT